MEFFVKLGENPIYKKLLKDPLTYVAGAVLLAVLNTANLAAVGGVWGVTGPLANWGAWLFKMVGGDVSTWAFFANEKAQASLNAGFLNDGVSVRNLGIIFGALIATLYASQFKIKKIKSGKQIVAAVIGGLLMGYGSRLSSGCNIGALFSGISAMSVAGWIFGLCLLAGAFVGSKLLVKYFL